MILVVYMKINYKLALELLLEDKQVSLFWNYQRKSGKLYISVKMQSEFIA